MSKPTLETFSNDWMDLLYWFKKAKAIDMEHAPDFGIGPMMAFQEIARGAKTAKDVSAQTGMSPPSVTRCVDSLVAENLVTRVHSADDRRNVELNVTEKGMVFIERRCEWMNKHVADLYNELSEEERVMAAKLLPRMKEVMQSW